MSYRNHNSEQPLELTDRGSSSSYPATPNMIPDTTEVALGQQGLQPTYAMQIGLESIPHVRITHNHHIYYHNSLSFWYLDCRVAMGQ
jgi:hypothetical protein